jgi:hypothetical protein
MSMWIVGSAVVISAGASIYAGVEGHAAARNAAAVDRATADFNARTDDEMARQLDLDTIENIRTLRAQATHYLSAQDLSYAAAGVLSDTGSALSAQITNAGRFEQEIQQKWVDSQQKQQAIYAKAAAGVLEGEAQAVSDTISGDIALINGIGQAAGTLGRGYFMLHGAGGTNEPNPITGQ